MIPVIWHEGVQWYGCTGFLNNQIEKTPLVHPDFSFQHFVGIQNVPDAAEAVVIIHGDHEVPKLYNIQQFLQKFDRAVVINLGDESARFPFNQLQGRGRRLWVQTAVPGEHDYARRIVFGYPPDAGQYIEKFKGIPKTRDWFFSGQITHLHRQRCAEQLRKLTNGLLVETQGFWQGLGREEYYQQMASAKIIPCPSGPVTPDSFRLWEALESGCVPIVDASCPKNAFPAGFWEYTLHQPPPFPVIQNWADLPAMIDAELARWPFNAMSLQAWWSNYKTFAYSWLATDFYGLRSAS